jgi:alkylhydroperoxidase family enzyme
MARLPYANPNDPERAEAAQVVTASRKAIGHLHRMLMHSPPISIGWIKFWDAVRRETKLSGALRELVICQVAAINGAQYEWNAHAPIGLKEGLRQEQLDALPDWAAKDVWNAAEKAALALCDEMTRKVHVADATMNAVKAALPEREVVELVVTIASYNCVSRVLEALEINGADTL